MGLGPALGENEGWTHFLPIPHPPGQADGCRDYHRKQVQHHSQSNFTGMLHTNTGSSFYYSESKIWSFFLSIFSKLATTVILSSCNAEVNIIVQL